VRSPLLHDLKTLIQSMHPVVTIDSPEEERVENVLRAVAAEMRLPLFTWTITRGLLRIDGQGMIHGTAHPLILLRHLATLTVRGIFHLKDFTPHLGEPAVVRAFKEAAQAFRRTRSTMVLSGEQTLPPELAREGVPLHLHLPDRDELRELLHRVLHAMKHQHKFDVTLGHEGMEQLLQTLSGLTLNQARQAIAWAIIDDGKLSEEDVPRLLKRKGETLQDGGLLEFYPPDENTFELGGFDRLKAWLERAHVGFGEEAQLLGLEPPRGASLGVAP
jgi:hypothetical protein